jgi:hypothetical protein
MRASSAASPHGKCVRPRSDLVPGRDCVGHCDLGHGLPFFFFLLQYWSLNSGLTP